MRPETEQTEMKSVNDFKLKIIIKAEHFHEQNSGWASDVLLSAEF